MHDNFYKAAIHYAKLSSLKKISGILQCAVTKEKTRLNEAPQLEGRVANYSRKFSGQTRRI